MPRETESSGSCRRRISRPARRKIEVAVRVLDPAWRRPRPEVLRAVRQAARATLDGAALGSGGQIELAIVLTDDAAVQRLNGQYRGIDKPTNVLSFGNLENGWSHDPEAPVVLGDVVLAYGTVAAEASAQGKTMADHTSHLVVHGILHLLGHDHQTSGEASAMEAIETDVLAGLGIADPYGRRPHPALPSMRAANR